MQNRPRLLTIHMVMAVGPSQAITNGQASFLRKSGNPLDDAFVLAEYCTFVPLNPSPAPPTLDSNVTLSCASRASRRGSISGGRYRFARLGNPRGRFRPVHIPGRKDRAARTDQVLPLGDSLRL